MAPLIEFDASASGLERWFAELGSPPRCDLARSGAPPLPVGAVLALGGSAARKQFLRLPLEYGDPAGSLRLRQAIVAAGAARHVDEVLVTTGAAEALLLAAAVMLRPGDRVRVATPAYEGLVRSTAATGGEVEPAPVWAAPSALLDPSALMRPGAVRAVIVNTPHNPTGLVWPRDLVDELARWCADRDARLLVDEVARGTLLAGAPSMSSLPEFAEGRVVVVGDVSKAYGLGGLRVGWLTSADRDLIRRAATTKDLTSLGGAAPSEFLAALALEHRGVLAERVAATARRNRRRLRDWVRGLDGAWCAEPEDGLVAFPRLPAGVDDHVLAARLRSQHQVAVVPGSLFGRAGHVRIALAQEPRLLDTGLKALTVTIGDAMRERRPSSALHPAWACAGASGVTAEPG